MQYKAVGFDPPASCDGTAGAAASALELLINSQAAGGWEFVGMENHSTVVPGSSGCFGMELRPPIRKRFPLLCFEDEAHLTALILLYQRMAPAALRDRCIFAERSAPTSSCEIFTKAACGPDWPRSR